MGTEHSVSVIWSHCLFSLSSSNSNLPAAGGFLPGDFARGGQLRPSSTSPLSLVNGGEEEKDGDEKEKPDEKEEAERPRSGGGGSQRRHRRPAFPTSASSEPDARLQDLLRTISKDIR